MSDTKLRGIVHYIEETKTYGQKGFRKRLVVLEQDNERFTNYLPVEFLQDACDSVDELAVGNDIEVTYRLSGRKWQKDAKSDVKYFLSAEAMNFQIMGSGSGGGGDVSSANAALAEAADVEDEPPF